MRAAPGDTRTSLLPYKLDRAGAFACIAIDDDVYMLETLISVFDKGRWIADLDPLETFTSNGLCIIAPCDHKNLHHNTANPRQRMTSIENWLELIGGPESRYAIVQAHRNWEARLAAASISVALGLHTLVLPLLQGLEDLDDDCTQSNTLDHCFDLLEHELIVDGPPRPLVKNRLVWISMMRDQIVRKTMRILVIQNVSARTAATGLGDDTDNC